jgi:hypothetical protein
VLGTNGGAAWANVLHCSLPTNTISTDAKLLTWLNAFVTAVSGANLYQRMGVGSNVTEFQANAYLAPGVPFYAQKLQTISGAGAGTLYPSNECFVLSWRSSAFWRGGKPRTYIPGLTSSMTDTIKSLSDTWKNATITAAQAMLTAVNAVTTADVPQTRLGFIHASSQGAWLVPPVFYEFSDVTVHDRVASQRRRLGHWLR